MRYLGEIEFGATVKNLSSEVGMSRSVFSNFPQQVKLDTAYERNCKLFIFLFIIFVQFFLLFFFIPMTLFREITLFLVLACSANVNYICYCQYVMKENFCCKILKQN